VLAPLAVALVLAAAQPPPAYVEPGHVPLALDGWCWGTRCGAPIARSTKSAVVQRGDTVTVELGFAPRSARAAVGGVQVPATISGRAVTWHATRGGGLTLNVRGGRGWVIYVGRLVVR
jgi:hypothetical protein